MTFRWHKPDPVRLRFLGGGSTGNDRCTDDRRVDAERNGDPADGAAARGGDPAVAQVVQSLGADPGPLGQLGDAASGTVQQDL